MQIENDDREEGFTASHGPTSEPLTLPARRGLPEIVAERLIEGIAAGTIRPGERLVETSLAASLGVSRAPLREAFRQLEAQGLVETRNGRGTHVRHLSSDHMEQMISVRAALEGLAARLVAFQGSAADHALIADVHDRFERAASAGFTEEWRRLDWEFHETVCRLSGNVVLLEAWRLVSMMVRVFLRKHQGFNPGTSGILRNHRAFVAAILSRDGDHAEQVFRSLILKSGYEQLGVPMPPALAGFPGQTKAAGGAAHPRKKTAAQPRPAKKQPTRSTKR